MRCRDRVGTLAWIRCAIPVKPSNYRFQQTRPPYGGRAAEPECLG